MSLKNFRSYCKNNKCLTCKQDIKNGKELKQFKTKDMILIKDTNKEILWKKD